MDYACIYRSHVDESKNLLIQSGQDRLARLFFQSLDMSTEPTKSIRSFVRRQGRMTPGQKQALATHWPTYGLGIAHGQQDLHSLFDQPAPCVCEIGFGMGDSLLAMAVDNPAINYVGIEVHQPGVGMLLKNIVRAGVDNIRLYQEDAREVLARCLADESLAGVQLFFPDPWPKKRHHKRRIVQADFLDLIYAKLQPQGFFHLATDWQPCAEEVLEKLLADPRFNNRYGAAYFAPDRAGRPETKFERRGQRLGHGVWDLVFEKQSSAA